MIFILIGAVSRQARCHPEYLTYTGLSATHMMPRASLYTDPAKSSGRQPIESPTSEGVIRDPEAAYNLLQQKHPTTPPLREGQHDIWPKKQPPSVVSNRSNRMRSSCSTKDEFESSRRTIRPICIAFETNLGLLGSSSSKRPGPRTNRVMHTPG